MCVAHEYARELLAIDALGVNVQQPYTLGSGWKIPVYCDNRKVFSYPQLFSWMVERLQQMIEKHFSEVEVIAGVSTAGIAPGAIVARERELPFIYVRPEAKKYGKLNQIEGVYQLGQKVLVIEDLVFAGESSLHVVEALRQAGLEVLGVMAMFSYDLPLTQQAFHDAQVSLYSVGTFAALIDVAIEQGLIYESDREVIAERKKDPSAWGQESVTV